MKEELDKRLTEEFPNLYRNRRGNPQETCMVYGFDVGDGWFDLIYNLSVKLEKLILELPEDVRHECCASQVKEKFAGLRFYMDSATPEMYDLTHEAESLSFQICEECGEPGKTSGSGYIQTLCDTHAKKDKK